MTFQFYMPTRIMVGRNCLSENGGRLAELGSKAFIMSGKNSAARNGSLRDMTAALDGENISWYHYNGVKPNPSLEDVRKAAALAQGEKTDFIVALGGGSPMDAAKAVAVLAAGKVSDEALLSQRTFDRVLPLAVVPTTSGTGSEVTPYSILTNDKLRTKSFLNSEQIYPRLAFLDGRYTMDLPESITGATVIDALSHAAEGYLAVRAMPPGRALALESLRLIGEMLPLLANGTPLSLEQRDKLLYASMVAGIVISQSGTTAVHALGYSLTYFKGVDHGAANGMILAEYLRFIEKERPGETGTILRALGMETPDELEDLTGAILGRLSLDMREISRFASIAIRAGNILNTCPKPSEEDLIRILTNCFSNEGE